MKSTSSKRISTSSKRISTSKKKTLNANLLTQKIFSNKKSGNYGDKTVIKKVAIIMGSTTDLKTMKDASKALSLFKIPYHIEVVSAHRTPEKMQDFALIASSRFSVIIAGAGGAAHLPGMVASLTTLPVIGVPVLVGKVKGMDALLSIAQMPKSVPVACVGIDNAFNAGLLAARIIGISNEKIASELEKYRKSQIKKVSLMNKRLK